MRPTLALIHTSQVFLNVETMMRDLFAEIMPDVRLINIMDDSLLPDCMAGGVITPAATKRMVAYVLAAEDAGAHAVLSLCSSLGPTIDVARPMVEIPVIKIDDPHTELAVGLATRIGVMATVATTLGPTVDLLRQKAAAAGKRVDIEESLSAAAFETLMRGDREAHDEAVLGAARTLGTRGVELIVLAQASMTRLAGAIEAETGLRVLSSPRLAIEHTKRVLDERMHDLREASPQRRSA